MNNFEPKIKLNAKNGGLSFACLMALFVLISFVGQTLAQAFFGKGSTAFIVVCSFFSLISLFLVVLLFTVFSNNDFIEYVPLKKFHIEYLFLAVMLSAGMFLGLGFVNDAFATMLGAWGLNVSGITIPLKSATHLILFSLLYALLPAITEELFFRGLLFSTLKGVGRITSCLIVALCFALYHCSATQFIYQFIYGFSLCLLVMVSKSVITCIIAHFINNFAVLIFGYFNVNINLYDPVVLIIGINLLAITFTAFYLLIKKTKKPMVEKGQALSFFFPYGVLGIIVCLSLLLGNLFV